MKTKEELSALKEEMESLHQKLAALSDDELREVAGGTGEYEHRESYNYLYYEDLYYRLHPEKFDGKN